MHILFQRNEGSPDLTFVEIENELGESVTVGEWSDRDGFAVLAIPDAAGSAPVYTGSTREEQAKIVADCAERSGLPDLSEHEQRAQIEADENLAVVLGQIVEHDRDYDVRYGLVFRAVPLALAAGYAAGVRIDPTNPEWPVVYIELPDGQVSWHMPQHQQFWDQHDTAEKHRRIAEYQQAYAPL